MYFDGASRDSCLGLYGKGYDSIMSYNNNCVMPEVRKNVWVVYDLEGQKIGEVGANSESEARQLVYHHVKIPFRLSHIEE